MKHLIILLSIIVFIFLNLDMCHSQLMGGGCIVSGASEDYLGNESTGGSSSAMTANRIYLSSAEVAGHSGTATLVTVYCSSTSATQDLEISLYDGATYSTATQVGSEILISDIGSFSVTSKEYDVSGQSWSITAGHTYWIGIATNTASSFTYYYDSGTLHYLDFVFGSWPDPFGTEDGNAARDLEIFVTYEY